MFVNFYIFLLSKARMLLNTQANIGNIGNTGNIEMYR